MADAGHLKYLRNRHLVFGRVADIATPLAG